MICLSYYTRLAKLQCYQAQNSKRVAFYLYPMKPKNYLIFAVDKASIMLIKRLQTPEFWFLIFRSFLDFIWNPTCGSWHLYKLFCSCMKKIFRRKCIVFYVIFVTARLTMFIWSMLKFLFRPSVSCVLSRI